MSRVLCIKESFLTFLSILSFLILIYQPVRSQKRQWMPDDRLINPCGVQNFGHGRIDVGDIDGDSWLDLVVLDSMGLRMYRNLGSTDPIRFERRPDWEFDPQQDPSYEEIPALADLNSDGRVDFILPDSKHSALRYWQNTGSVSSQFWTRCDSVLRPLLSRNWISFADMDNDGDEDAFTEMNHRLKCYRNLGEKHKSHWCADSLIAMRPISTNMFCGNVRFADYDHDGRDDIFESIAWGFTETIVKVGRNISSVDSLQWKFPYYGEALAESWVSSLAVGDINQDGRLELLTGHATPFLFVWSCDFGEQKSSFTQIGNLGFPFGWCESGLTLNLRQDGSGEIITVHREKPTDYEPQFLGFKTFLLQNSLWRSVPCYYPVFQVNHCFLGNPTLHQFDWEGDGETDYVLGAEMLVYRTGAIDSTTLVHLRNNEWQSGLFTGFQRDSLFQDPSLIDINSDGRLDLFLQQRSCYCFYENIGTLADPKWQKRPQWSANLCQTLQHYRAALGDLTGDGLLDIVFGEKDGSLSCFENTGSKTQPQWQQVDGGFAHVSVTAHAIPALIDLDFDHDLDLIVGDHLGRFFAYRNDFTSTVKMKSGSRAYSALRNYPNPFNPQTTIEFTLCKPQNVTVTVYDLLGRKVDVLMAERKAAGVYVQRWPMDCLAGGIYFIHLQSDEFSQTIKAVLIK